MPRGDKGSYTDKQKRKAMYREWIDIAYREQPFIYTTTTERVVAIRNKMEELLVTAHEQVTSESK